MVRKVRFIAALIGFAIGAVFGLGTGIAMGGGASNGSMLFGVLGALIGWVFVVPLLDAFARWHRRRSEQE